VHELIVASSGCVSFDSTVIEEVLMVEKPLVNFSVKTHRHEREISGNFKLFKDMWNSEFCLNINLLHHDRVSPSVKILNFMNHFRKDINYRKIQKKTFFVPGTASEKIVNYIKNLGLLT